MWWSKMSVKSNMIFGCLAFSIRLKKKKSYVSKLPRAFVFQCTFDSAKLKVWIFFCLLIFFPSFYELACQNIQEKIWQTQWNTLNNRLLQLCVLSCILFIQNQVSYFKAVNDSNLTCLLLRGKKKKKTLVKKTAFRSGLPICHELWDITFIFFFSLRILFRL